MKTLIVCLGYDLDASGNITPLLKNRLDKVIEMLKDSSRQALLMGASNYRDLDDDFSQAVAMKTYLLGAGIAANKLHIEETTASAVEQLCYIRRQIDEGNSLFDDEKLIIISSEGFNERIKLYAEYIFNNSATMEFIGAELPAEIADTFKNVESEKLKKAEIWLSNNKKGDYLTILNEQLAFQSNINTGEIEHPRS